MKRIIPHFSLPVKRFLLLTLVTFLCVELIAGPIVVIRIEIGRPKKGCTGFGICDFQFGFERNATAQADGNNLKITFDRSFTEQNSEAFRNGYFQVDEPYTLSNSVVQKLGETGEITIKPGKYNLTYERGLAIINIPY